MNNLPTELLSAIVKHVGKNDLCTCTLVNKTFYLATIPILWGTYIENSYGGESPMKLLHCLETPEQQQHPMSMHLQKLVLRCEWDDTAFLRLLPHISRLEELTIGSRKKLGNAAFQQLPSYCPNLKTLQINGMELTQQIMDAIGQHCHQLEDLDLQHCPPTMTRPFAPLIQHGCRSLKKLVIANAYTEQHWKQDIWMDVTPFSQLTRLEFLDDSVDVVQRLVSLLSATSTSLVWPHLTHLSIGVLGDLGDSQLIPLIQARPLLQLLSLKASNKLTDTTLDAIATFLPGLIGLQLSWTLGLTAPGLRRLVHHCSQIKYIGLFGCYLTNADFPEAGEGSLNADGVSIEGYRTLYDLDQNALSKIRLGSDPSGSTQYG